MPTENDLWLGGVVSVVLLGGCALEAWRDARADVDRSIILRGWVLAITPIFENQGTPPPGRNSGAFSGGPKSHPDSQL